MTTLYLGLTSLQFEDTVVGAGAVIVRNTEEGLVYRGNPAVGSPPRTTTLLRPRQ
jgi:hypothetical protein